MAKVPDSNKSESWTARVPNDLADLARDKAINLGMINNLGKPNTTLIIHAALRSWLELPNDISNSVSNTMPNDLSNGVIQVLESRLDELTNVISNTVKRDELPLFKEEILERVNSVLEPLKFGLETIKSEILQNVELMIAASMNTQAVVNPAIATPETKHNQLDLTDIPAIAVSPEILKIKAASVFHKDRFWRNYKRSDLESMNSDEVKKVYVKAVHSSERPKGSVLHSDKISRLRMIEMILERSQISSA
jgi:hypothetical protein